MWLLGSHTSGKALGAKLDRWQLDSLTVQVSKVFHFSLNKLTTDYGSFMFSLSHSLSVLSFLWKKSKAELQEASSCLS